MEPQDGQEFGTPALPHSVHWKPLTCRRCSEDGAFSSLPWRGQSGFCQSYTPRLPGGPTAQPRRRGPGRRRGRGLQLAREPGTAEADSRLPGGWTPAPRVAAERSARNLLTGPEQRAANPAGGPGRAGGRRDPAPSPHRCRIHRAFPRRGLRGRTRRSPPRLRLPLAQARTPHRGSRVPQSTWPEASL